MPCSSPPKIPLYVRGEVTKGFGRGSKDLGIPTANYPEEIVDNFSDCLGTGIYCGWACVNNGPVYKMVMSVGWNPFYKNQKKSMETHIIHEFQDDFYGAELSLVILAYLRPEQNYPSLETLIEAIHNDIKNAKDTLDKPEFAKYATDSFFTSTRIEQNQTSNTSSSCRTNGVNSKLC